MAKYNEMMDHVKVDEAMRARVMDNVKKHIRETGRTGQNAVYAEEKEEKQGAEEIWSVVPMVKRRRRILPILGSLAAACAILAAVDPWGTRKPMTESAEKAEVVREADTLMRKADSLPADSAAAGADEAGENREKKGAADSAVAEKNRVMAIWDHAEYQNPEEMEQELGFSVPDPETLPIRYTRKEYSSITGNLAQIAYFDGEERCMIFRKSSAEGDCSGNYNRFECEKKIAVDGIRDITVKMNGNKAYLAVWSDGTFSWSIDDEQGVSENQMAEMIRAFMKS